MQNSLQLIKERMGRIEAGLLRFPLKLDRKISYPIRLSPKNGNMLQCNISEDDDLQVQPNKRVTLIQRSENDYLYVTGIVDKLAERDSKSISIMIEKACWFVRKTKGSVSWMQQKHLYQKEIA